MSTTHVNNNAWPDVNGWNQIAWEHASKFADDICCVSYQNAENGLICQIDAPNSMRAKDKTHCHWSIEYCGKIRSSTFKNLSDVAGILNGLMEKLSPQMKRFNKRLSNFTPAGWKMVCGTDVISEPEFTCSTSGNVDVVVTFYDIHTAEPDKYPIEYSVSVVNTAGYGNSVISTHNGSITKLKSIYPLLDDLKVQWTK